MPKPRAYGTLPHALTRSHFIFTTLLHSSFSTRVLIYSFAVPPAVSPAVLYLPWPHARSVYRVLCRVPCALCCGCGSGAHAQKTERRAHALHIYCMLAGARRGEAVSARELQRCQPGARTMPPAPRVSLRVRRAWAHRGSAYEYVGRRSTYEASAPVRAGPERELEQ